MVEMLTENERPCPEILGGRIETLKQKLRREAGESRAERRGSHFSTS